MWGVSRNKLGEGATVNGENHKSSVSVVIAALNEEEGICPTLEELQKVLNYPHLIVVDGNSADRTVEIAKMDADVLLQDG